LYNIRLGSKTPSQRYCQKIFKIHRSLIEALISPLFGDVHELLFHSGIEIDSPPPKSLTTSWNSCYGTVYSTASHACYVNTFLDAIPYFLTYAVLGIYESLPVPLGISPPDRVDVCRRVVFLFTTLLYLDSHLEDGMTKYFGPKEVLPPVPKRFQIAPVFLPVEDTSRLVDLERRHRDAKIVFHTNRRSPISKTSCPREPDTTTFLYPMGGERSFKDMLQPFTQKKKPPEDFTPNLETNSLLMRASCACAEHTLQKTQMDAAVKRTGFMHRFVQDTDLIRIKKAAVCAASPAMQEKFMAQLHQNHEKGIFLEDPAVTIDLLRDVVIPARPPPPLEPNPRDVTHIVDSVLNECAVEHRRRVEVEVHMTHEFRNSVIDVKRVFEQPKRKPTISI
jgi:hypothetical protein